MFDIVIIGAGIAGLTAAIYGRRAGRSVLVLEGKVPGGQIINTPTIENWPGDMGVSGVDLIQKIQAQAEGLGAELEYEEVLAIEPDSVEFKIKTEDAEYQAKTVIIAVGTDPRKLSEAQTKDAGKRLISYCATCDGALYKNKPVVVIGSGNTAKQEIQYLKNICSRVYQIHHNDPIPADAEAVFVAIGRVPATKIFADLVELDVNGYVVAEEDCKTSCSGVFVAGDCRTKSVRQLVTAAGDGAIAAGAAIDYLA